MFMLEDQIHQLYLGSSISESLLKNGCNTYGSLFYSAPYLYYMKYGAKTQLMRMQIDHTFHTQSIECAVPYDHVGYSYSPFVSLRPYTVDSQQTIYFTSRENGGLYRYSLNKDYISKNHINKNFINQDHQEGLQLLFLRKHMKFANLIHTPYGILCLVCETFKDVQRQYVGLITHDGSECIIVHSGYDYYMDLVYDQDTQMCAVMTSSALYLPWNRSQIHMLNLQNLKNSQNFYVSESITFDQDHQAYAYPVFDNNTHDLYFLNDRRGYLSPYYIPYKQWENGLIKKSLFPYKLSYPKDTEVGFSIPFMNQNVYDVKDGNCFARSAKNGIVCLVQTNKISHRTLNLGFSDVNHLQWCGNFLAFVGSFTDSEDTLVVYDPELQVWQTVDEGKSSSGHVSKAKNLCIKKKIALYGPAQHTHDTVSGNYYAPYCDNHQKTAIHYRKKAPLIVKIHGGPTDRASPNFQPVIQFWTSLGFAYLDVNYHGSLGFGRSYRTALDGLWGVLDVDDVIQMVDYVRKRYPVKEIFLDGSSAGGMTALRASMQAPFFSGVSVFAGVYDFNDLPETSFAFERYFADTLIGAWPKHQQIYKKRSPINHIDDITIPLLVMHGTHDPVIPYSSFVRFTKALKQGNKEYIAKTFENGEHFISNADHKLLLLSYKLAFYKSLLI